MKLFTRVLLPLAGAGAAFFAATFFLPKQCEVSQSIVLDATPDQVYPFLNNPTKWEEWSAWTKEQDPTVIHLYGGPMAGVGARHSWKGDKLGNSDIIFTESVSPSVVAYEQSVAGHPYRTKGRFKLESTPAGTRLVWLMVTPLEDTPIGLIKGILKKHRTEEELKLGLTGLKTLLERNSKRRASR